jgi:hypothetical protein
LQLPQEVTHHRQPLAAHHHRKYIPKDMALDRITARTIQHMVAQVLDMVVLINPMVVTTMSLEQRTAI